MAREEGLFRITQNDGMIDSQGACRRADAPPVSTATTFSLGMPSPFRAGRCSHPGPPAHAVQCTRSRLQRLGQASTGDARSPPSHEAIRLPLYLVVCPHLHPIYSLHHYYRICAVICRPTSTFGSQSRMSTTPPRRRHRRHSPIYRSPIRMRRSRRQRS
jgi:hypothetical protein